MASQYLYRGTPCPRHNWRQHGRAAFIALLVSFCSGLAQISPQSDAPLNLSTRDFAFNTRDARIKYSPQGFTLPYVNLSVWSKQELYDLDKMPSVTFEFDAMLTAEQQELIVAFSQNKMPWGQPDADALTVRVTPPDQNVWIRTGFYKNGLDNSLRIEDKVRVIFTQKWQHYKIQLTKQEIIFSVDGREMGQANLNDASFPHKGFIGFIVVGNPEIAETTISFSLQGVPESAESESRGVKPLPSPAGSSEANTSLSSPGRYYALVIAVQDYVDNSINDLDYPIQDAQNMISALTTNYTFDSPNVTFLKNPTKDQVSDAFDLLIKQVTARDNLLIFYAGHGYWDERLKQGFWLLADAKKDFRSNWLSNGTIRDYVNGINSKHTLLISDACFSGGIFKTRAAFSGPSRALEELYKSPSRKAMTSGAMKEVPDKSVFVSFLIKKLQENAEQFLSVQNLFSSLREPVTNNSPNSQVPQFGVIRETGDEDGEFVFIRRK